MPVRLWHRRLLFNARFVERTFGSRGQGRFAGFFGVAIARSGESVPARILWLCRFETSAGLFNRRCALQEGQQCGVVGMPSQSGACKNLNINKRNP